MHFLSLNFKKEVKFDFFLIIIIKLLYIVLYYFLLKIKSVLYNLILSPYLFFKFCESYLIYFNMYVFVYLNCTKNICYTYIVLNWISFLFHYLIDFGMTGFVNLHKEENELVSAQKFPALRLLEKLVSASMNFSFCHDVNPKS